MGIKIMGIKAMGQWGCQSLCPSLRSVGKCWGCVDSQAGLNMPATAAQTDSSRFTQCVCGHWA